MGTVTHCNHSWLFNFMFTMAAKAKITLTVEQKMEALKMYDNVKSTRKVGEAFGVGKDQISRLVKNREAGQEEFFGPKSTKRKRLTNTSNEEINRLMKDWVTDMNQRKLHLSGPAIQAKALELAAEINSIEFKASFCFLFYSVA